MRHAATLLLLLAAPIHAQERADRFLEAERMGFEAFEKKDFDAARAAFERQIAIFGDNPRPYYNIACAHALQGNAARAATWLELSIQRGWRNTKHLDADPDFDAIRKSPAFRRARALLDDLPAIEPQEIDPFSTQPANSMRRLMAEAIITQAALDLDERLWEPEQIQARLYGHYDRIMARLARYLLENGDARDAHEAARERVRIASLYRLGNEESRPVAALIRRTAGEFVSGWPTSPHLHTVQLWRSYVEPDAVAVPALRKLYADAGDGEVAIRALAELCRRDDPEHLKEFERRFRTHPLGRELYETRLGTVRLRVHGLPDLSGIAFDPPLPAPREGRLVIAILRAGDRIPARWKRETVAVAMFGGKAPRGVHVARDPAALARAVHAQNTPSFYIFDEAKLVDSQG
ncbi:MAG: hypothetical protein AAGD14_07390 [Planctomycetota bacterium]